MMDRFKIYLDRLANDQVEKISETLSSDFLKIEESDLSFVNPVEIKGEAYLANDHLIIHLVVKTQANMPCSICNEMIPYSVNIDNFYHAEEMTKSKTTIFDFSDVLREGILIDIPPFLECNGKCPKRKEVDHYFKKENKLSSSSEEIHYPFKGLDEQLNQNQE